MLRLNQKITINGLELPFVQTVEIKDSRNDFTNTAKINIQNRINSQGNKISDIIEKGSEVIIQLGYFPKLFEEFRGYVSQVIPDKTAVIMCENESYQYKRQSVGVDIIQKSTTLKALIGAIYSGPSEIYDANIGDWKVSKTSTLIDVLSELQSKFKIYCYFSGKTLIVGAQADTREKATIIADFQKNIPSGESSFNFKQASADKIVVKATNVQRDGVINEVYAFYEGTPSVITFSNVAPTSGSISEFNIGGQSALTIQDLRELAQIRLEALSFTGCDGTITTYGYPSVSQGDICRVKDLDVPEKDGDYAIVEVVKRFGVNIGYRQNMSLGISL